MECKKVKKKGRISLVLFKNRYLHKQNAAFRFVLFLVMEINCCLLLAIREFAVLVAEVVEWLAGWLGCWVSGEGDL